MNKRRWGDLSNCQKAGVIVLGTIQVGLLVAALWDLAHRDDDELRGDRRMWAGLVFINWFGPLAYFTIGRKDSLCSHWCGRQSEAETTAGLTETDSISFSP